MNQTISFHTLLNLFSAIIALIFFLIILRLILHSKLSKPFRAGGVIMGLLFSIIIWYFAGFMIYSPLANTFPQKKDVPCFVLNKNNCGRRVDCRADSLIGGLGKDSFWCSSKKKS